MYILLVYTVHLLAVCVCVWGWAAHLLIGSDAGEREEEGGGGQQGGRWPAPPPPPSNETAGSRSSDIEPPYLGIGSTHSGFHLFFY